MALAGETALTEVMALSVQVEDLEFEGVEPIAPDLLSPSMGAEPAAH